MQPEVLIFSRRRLLSYVAAASALCGRSFAFASDFWNKKAPKDWSDDEIHQLLNKSPWAKSVSSEVARNGSGSKSVGGNNGGMGNGTGNGGMGTGTGNNRGLSGTNPGSSRNDRSGMGGMGNGGGMGSGGGGGAPKSSAPTFKGVVRWESAQPVLDASKAALPDPFANHYVISLSGFPLNGRKPDSDAEAPKPGKNALDRIKAASSLTPKDKDAVQADVVQVVGSSLFIGFPKDSAKLSADDKEVAFATMIGRMVVRAKFSFKEMMYHESLAI